MALLKLLKNDLSWIYKMDPGYLPSSTFTMEPTSSTKPFYLAYYPLYTSPLKILSSIFNLPPLFFFTTFMNFSWRESQILWASYLSSSVKSVKGEKSLFKALLYNEDDTYLSIKLSFRVMSYPKDPVASSSKEARLYYLQCWFYQHILHYQCIEHNILQMLLFI